MQLMMATMRCCMDLRNKKAIKNLRIMSFP